MLEKRAVFQKNANDHFSKLTLRQTKPKQRCRQTEVLFAPGGRHSGCFLLRSNPAVFHEGPPEWGPLSLASPTPRPPSRGGCHLWGFLVHLPAPDTLPLGYWKNVNCSLRILIFKSIHSTIISMWFFGMEIPVLW